MLIVATNEIVEQWNDKMVDNIPDVLHSFANIDTVDDVDTIVFSQELFNSLNLSGLPSLLSVGAWK